MINLGNPPRPTSGIGSVSTQNLNERIKEVENYIDATAASDFASATVTTTGDVTIGGRATVAWDLVLDPALVSNGAGAAALSLRTAVTALTTTAAGTLTLADGTPGQVMIIIHEVDGGSAVLTPATKTGFSTITFTDVADTATLVFLATRGWFITSLRGAVAA